MTEGAVLVAGEQQLGTLEDLLAFKDYARAFWRVRTKTGELIPFVLNAPQRILDYEVEQALASGEPARIRCLKSRQQGISTYCTARMQHRCQTLPGQKAISVADKKELPQKWLDRGKRWFRETPAVCRPAMRRSNMLELFFEGFDARYGIGSARGQTPGMGDTLNAAHLSELSNWPVIEKVLADLLPAVPKNDPSSLVIEESTGELEGDEWHGRVADSIEGADNYRFVFLPWFITEEYVMNPARIGLGAAFGPEDYTEEECAFVAAADRWAAEHPEHAELAGYAGVTPGRIAWRRWTITNEFAGDLDLFKSRYPATVAEAFMGIGSLALPIQIIRRHRETAVEPVARVTLARDMQKQIRAHPFEGEGPVELWAPHWRIYQERETYCEYAIGADVMKGEVSDQADERSERDWATIGVLNRRTMETVALYRGRVEADDLGEQMLLAGEYWNWAWLSPESNNYGMATLKVVKDYQRLMPREGSVAEIAERQLSKLGWETTAASRDLLIDTWLHYCREDLLEGYEGRIVCLCPELAGEEATFVRKKTGKREHRPGRHDDILFAGYIALQVHLRCPHDRLTPWKPPARSAAALREIGVVIPRSQDYAGGIDDEPLDRPGRTW